MFTVQMEWMLPLIQVEISVEVYYSNGLIQWAQTKLVHMTLGNTSVLCTSLVCAHCITDDIGMGNWGFIPPAVYNMKMGIVTFSDPDRMVF